MASKSSAGGFALLIGAGLLFYASSSKAEPKTEPKKDEPKPLPKSCVRTFPGDGPGNGKEAAVRAWQECLVASGCLASDQVDGKHGPMTEKASKAYEASGGKCSSPVGPAVGPATPPKGTDRVWMLTKGQSSDPQSVALQAKLAAANAGKSVRKEFEAWAISYAVQDKTGSRDGTYFVYNAPAQNLSVAKQVDSFEVDTKIEIVPNPGLNA
jgi:peptidoglycan hydrolase-like protein with peptidoglycan-binding domain